MKRCSLGRSADIRPEQSSVGASLEPPRPASAAIIALLLAGCATGIAPEKAVVTRVDSLPPVQVPIPVRCVKEIPPIPDVKIDASATPLQRYYQLKETVLAYENYIIAANAVIIGCATPPEKKKE